MRRHEREFFVTFLPIWFNLGSGSEKPVKYCRQAFQIYPAMNSPFKTVALIGKHKNPDIMAPLLRLGEYLENRRPRSAAGFAHCCHHGAGEVPRDVNGGDRLPARTWPSFLVATAQC